MVPFQSILFYQSEPLSYSSRSLQTGGQTYYCIAIAAFAAHQLVAPPVRKICQLRSSDGTIIPISYRGRTILSATEVFLLPVKHCGIVYRQVFNECRPTQAFCIARPVCIVSYHAFLLTWSSAGCIVYADVLILQLTICTWSTFISRVAQ